VPTNEPKVDCPNNEPTKTQTKMADVIEVKLPMRLNVVFSLESDVNKWLFRARNSAR
jgi:hypothetical protein